MRVLAGAALDRGEDAERDAAAIRAKVHSGQPARALTSG
jgi:hypothetical protein